MLAGLMDNTSFGETLCALAQRHAGGVLQIETARGMACIFFAQGRISNFEAAWHGLEGLRQRLLAAGYKLRNPLSVAGDYLDLYLAVVEQGALNQEIFEIAVRSWVLDGLYSLDLREPVRYEFKPHAPATTALFWPSISVAQLLLDLAAKAEVQREFEEAFGQRSGLAPTGTVPEFKTREEELVYALVCKQMSTQDLMRISLLGYLGTAKALLELHRRDLIKSVVCEDNKADFGPTVSRNAAYGRLGRVAIWNARLLHSPYLALIIAYLFLAVVLIVPFLRWDEIMDKFGRF